MMLLHWVHALLWAIILAYLEQFHLKTPGCSLSADMRHCCIMTMGRFYMLVISLLDHTKFCTFDVKMNINVFVKSPCITLYLKIYIICQIAYPLCHIFSETWRPESACPYMSNWVSCSGRPHRWTEGRNVWAFLRHESQSRYAWLVQEIALIRNTLLSTMALYSIVFSYCREMAACKGNPQQLNN